MALGEIESSNRNDGVREQLRRILLGFKERLVKRDRGEAIEVPQLNENDATELLQWSITQLSDRLGIDLNTAQYIQKKSATELETEFPQFVRVNKDGSEDKIYLRIENQTNLRYHFGGKPRREHLSFYSVSDTKNKPLTLLVERSTDHLYPQDFLFSAQYWEGDDAMQIAFSQRTNEKPEYDLTRMTDPKGTGFPEARELDKSAFARQLLTFLNRLPPKDSIRPYKKS